MVVNDRRCSLYCVAVISSCGFKIAVWPGMGITGVIRYFRIGYGGLLYRESLRKTQAGTADQSGQDMGRGDRRDSRRYYYRSSFYFFFALATSPRSFRSHITG